MSDKATKTALPKLRFPEFQEAEPWNIVTLGSIAKLIKEKAGSKRYKLMSITSGLGLVSQMEKFGREIAGDSYKNYYVIKKGDFAYNKSSTKLDPEGQIALLENEESGAVPNSIFTCFRVDEKRVTPSFLKYPFINNIHGEWLRNFIQVGARANGALSVDNKDLLALPLAVPSLPEQQKIADTLSSLDDLITAQSDKLEALQNHKRGLMQDLFPAEGETVPKRRFPEFRETGEWKEVTLSTQVELVSGVHLSPDEYSSQGDVPYFSGPSDCIDELTHVKKWTKRSKNSGRVGDILVTVKGSGSGELFPLLLNEVVLGRQLMAIRPVTAQGEYIFHLLTTQRQRLESLATGNLIPGLSRLDILSLKLFVPEYNEQQKIADCITSLDNLITAQSQKIEALKLHKKGLMQALFPAASEAEA